jgi:hypothetical protein
MLSAGNNPGAPQCRGTPNGDLGDFSSVKYDHLHSNHILPQKLLES